MRNLSSPYSWNKRAVILSCSKRSSVKLRSRAPKDLASRLGTGPLDRRPRRQEGESNQGPNILADPVEDLGEAEFVAVHGAVDECVSVQAFNLDVKAIAPQEDIGGG